MTDYAITLYVTGSSIAGAQAVANIRAICDAALPDGYRLKVIDVLGDPQAADDAHIVATPTLIRTAPPPQRRVIGDLSDFVKVRSILDLAPPTTSESAP